MSETLPPVRTTNNWAVISLVLELVLGRVKWSSLGVHDLAGFVLLVAGYVIIVSKPPPQ